MFSPKVLWKSGITVSWPTETKRPNWLFVEN